MLLQGNEHRGNDATGMALSQPDGTVDVYKDNVAAWQFVRSKGYEQFLEKHLKKDTWGAILHTRLATKGDPIKNANNHPMYGKQCAVVHNGHIKNDDTLFATNNFTRSCETDSDIIRAFVDKFGITPKAINEMNKMHGSAAGAIFHPKYPRKMLLFRSGNPMVLASTKDFFMFSSEQNTIYKAMRPYVKRFGIWFHLDATDLAFGPMADDTAWIIGEKGQEYNGEFHVLSGTYVEPNRQTYEHHQYRKNKFSNTHEMGFRGSVDLTKFEPTTYNPTRTPVSNVITPTQNPTSKVGPQPLKRVNKDDGFCVACNRLWNVPKGANPRNYYCNKEHGGCGASLVETPIDALKE